MSENFTSIKTFRDFLLDKQNPIVMVTLLLSGKSFLEKATFRIELRQHTNAHDEFCIVVPDTAVDSFEGYVLQNSKNLLGQKLTVSFHRYGVVVQSFTGVISKIINKKNKGGGYGDLHIIGHAPSILLENGKDCQSFQDKTLPEIIAQSTAEYGNDVEIKVEGGINHKYTLPYTVQYKESDYQFLSRLARRYGEFFYYNGTHLIFGNQAQNTVEVEEGSELIDVEFELLIKPQKFTYVSYDVEKGELQERPSYLETTQNKENPFAQVAKNASERVYQKIPEMYFSGVSQSDVNGELEAVVRREKEHREHLMQVRGRSREPQLRIGGFIKLRDINNKAMETYRIIDIKHYQSGYEYYNEFVAIPDVFVAYYFDENAYARSEQQPAQVVDNNDPEGLGRVRVQFLWQRRKGEKTPWIRVAQPHAGAGKGFYFIPEIGEEVLVDFEDQNAERPFVLGSYYNGKQKSGFATPNNDVKVIKTRSNHTILLDDSDKSMSITILDQSGNTIYLDTTQKSITIEAPETIHIKCKNLNVEVAENAKTNIGKTQETHIGENAKTIVGKENSLDSGGKMILSSGKTLEISAKQDLDLYGKQKLISYTDGKAEIGAKERMHLFGTNSLITAKDKIEYKAPKMNKLPQKGEFKYDKEPKVIEMYWSYGEENTILSNISKHYTDMDLIVNTRNYEVGESITITIKAEDNEPIAEGLNEITLTGIVNENNQVVFEQPLKEYSLCITNNIIEDKIEEENKIYKTYQGKNYTKGEWDVFEEQLYREYLERKKKKFLKF